MYLNKLLFEHKKAYLVDNNGFSVPGTMSGFAGMEFPVNYLCDFTGISFDENGIGFFGDNLELTCNFDTVLSAFKEDPRIGWTGTVLCPLYGNRQIKFKITNVAIDRTIGLCFIRANILRTQ